MGVCVSLLNTAKLGVIVGEEDVVAVGCVAAKGCVCQDTLLAWWYVCVQCTRACVCLCVRVAACVCVYPAHGSLVPCVSGHSCSAVLTWTHY